MSTADWVAPLTHPTLPAPDDLRSWNGSDPAQRFAVYRNNVQASLHQVLADTFPVVQALLGATCFDGLAHRYLLEHLPESPVLAHYGKHFAEFAGKQPEIAALPYLADVAHIEMARLLALHAADAPALPPAALSPLLDRPDLLPGLKLLLLPAVRVVNSSYAIVSLWAAHQGEAAADLATLDPYQPERALISRPGLEVLVQSISAGNARFISSLQQGLPLGNAFVAAMTADSRFDLAAALGLLLEQGLLTSMAVVHPQRMEHARHACSTLTSMAVGHPHIMEHPDHACSTSTEFSAEVSP